MAAVSLTAGSLPTWILVGIALIAAWRLSRGGAGGAVQELSAANRVLERRIHDLGAEVRDLRIENAELRGRTDFSAVIAQHEVRAQDRADSMLVVLNLIAQRLGPEPNGA